MTLLLLLTQEASLNNVCYLYEWSALVTVRPWGVSSPSYSTFEQTADSFRTQWYLTVLIPACRYKEVLIRCTDRQLLTAITAQVIQRRKLRGWSRSLCQATIEVLKMKGLAVTASYNGGIRQGTEENHTKK